MRTVAFLIAVSGVCAGIYSGDQIVRVETVTDELRTKFMGMAQEQDIDVLGVWEDHIDIHLPKHRLQATSLASMGFNSSVTHEDVQQVSDHLFSEWVCDPTKHACATDDFYTRYQPLNIIEQRFTAWAGANGRFVRLVTIGTSHLGRPIRGYILTSPVGNPQQKLKAFYNCGIHAREWLPVPFCLWLGEQLLAKYETDATARLILDNFDIHVVPVLNVDGYLHTFTGVNMWRKSRKPNPSSTCIGTDLNRNLPYQWGTGGSSNNPCSDTFMGARPLDNPETDALNRYVAGLRPIVYMDIHASGLMWLAPLGFRPRSACPSNPRGCGSDDDNAYRLYMENGQRSADAIAAVHGSRFRVGPITFIIYQASGSTVDQMHMVNGVRYPYSPEVRAGFQPNPTHIILSNQELEAGVFAQLEHAFRNSN